MEDISGGEEAPLAGGAAPAGFLLRFVAWFVDSWVQGLALLVVFVPLFLAGAELNVCYGASMLCAIAFMAWLESTFGGSAGKLLLKLRVTDLAGKNLPFLRSLARNLWKTFVSPLFFLGFLYACANQRGQALHDVMVDGMVRTARSS